MKTGRSLSDLAAEIERRAAAATDFVAEPSALRVVIETDGDRDAPNGVRGVPVVEGLRNGERFGILPHAERQMGTFLGIPATYWDRMRAEQPDLLAHNANAWLDAKSGERRLVRTLDGDLRAWLSSSYRPLDNADLLEAVLPQMMDVRGLTVQSCEVTDRRLYVKATVASVRREIKTSRQRGDIVEAGIVVSNSEVGAGSLRIEPFVHRLICTNGMIANDAAMKRAHVGRAYQGDGADVEAFVSDRTREVEDVAFWNRVRDVIRGVLRAEWLDAEVAKMERAAQDALPAEALGALDKVVAVTTKRLRLPDSSRGSILGHLAQGGDFSRWGILNAVTRTAEDLPDYEDATDFERAGGRVLEMTRRDWSKMTAEVLAAV